MNTDPRPLLAQMQFAFSQTLASLQATHIGAFMTGQESRYEAMHQGPPDFSEARKPHERPIVDFTEPRVSPVFHEGAPLYQNMLDLRQLNLKALPGDPLATRTSGVQTNPRGTNVRVITAQPTIQPAPDLLHPSRRSVKPMTVGAVNGSGTTGINPWWTYEEGALPGVGKWMVNVGTGNVIVQEDDVNVPERGIGLAFRRTYNSLSLHDNAGTDGSTPSNYGNGWTNTFDAHLGYNAATNVMTIWDIDGARYDYTSDGAGHWIAPPGEHAVLAWDGGCGYSWSKKSGTIYGFYSPTYSTCAGTNTAGYNGRVYEIVARNHNNHLLFNYFWDNSDASTSAHLNQLNIVHADGQQLTLRFADFSGYRELASITRPDGVQVTYQYDGSGNLTWVAEPMNNSNYGSYNHTWNANHQLHIVVSPVSAQTGGASGATPTFFYDGSNRVAGVFMWGLGNFAPSDGFNAPLQSGATGDQQLAYTTFSYPSATETQLTDADGHATNWFYDSVGRVTQTQEWTGAPNNLWLTTNASWDGSNNLTESVDARGSATDYGYDGNGNTVWVQQPWITTSLGYGRPVSRYSYDGYNNLVAYCDPQYVWTTGTSSCNAGSGVTYYTWNYSDGNEPYGYLTDTHTPLGYHHAIAYSTGSEGGGDYGLPTSVTGDCISQTDGTSRCPTMQLTYNAHGDVTQANTGNGTWDVSYDNLNRVTAATDPDGITSRTCYYQNGQASAKQTALQYSMDGGVVCGSHSTTFSYDADGNEIGETNHVNNAADTTNKWYDGADRLVEVRVPYDSAADAFQNPWITRYIYDLTQGGSVALSGASSVNYKANGNLYKTQELLMAGTNQSVSWYAGATKLANTTFQDTKGTAFDALDRPVTKYQFVNDVPHAENEAYDQNGYYGEATSHCNYTNQCATAMTYYTTGAIDQVTYNDGTPTETSTYDPDGRLATQQSSAFGTQTYNYDADSRLTSEVEPSGGGVTSFATLTYHYYADGMRSALDVASSALNQTSLFTYAYRTDGKLQTQQINYAADAKVGNSTLHFLYTSAGKLTQRTESGPAANPNAITFQYDGSTGVMNKAIYPTATLDTFTYDAAGELDSYYQSISGGVTNGDTYAGAFTYTNRGELTHDPRALGGAVFANGAQLASTSSGHQATWDGRNALLEGMANPYLNDSGGTTFGVDGDGRQTLSDQSGVDHYGNSYDITNARTYDAENHVLSSGQSAPWDLYQTTNHIDNTLTAYQWGPNGHPIRIGSTPAVQNAQPSTSQLAYDTLHWDGNQLLFTTNSAGQVDDIKIGSIGDITPLDSGYSGLTFYDRVSGAIAFCHNATGAAGNDKLAAQHSLIFGTNPATSPCKVYGTQVMSSPTSIVWGSQNIAGGVGQGHVLGMPGTDGITDGANTIQGVRSYDSVQGQWTTPDAYAGEIHDPMSQKSYMWNHNDPIAYSDPSGYLSVQQQDLLSGAIMALAFIMPMQTKEACTNFVLDLYQGTLGIDLRAEVRGDMVFHLAGYNHHGYSNLNFAGDVRNLHNFFSHTGQLHAFGSGRSQVGDILFIGKKGGGDLHHVAMVSSVDTSGNPTSVIEATGAEIIQKPWSDFAKAMNDQGLAVQDVGTDNNDSSSSGDAGPESSPYSPGLPK